MKNKRIFLGFASVLALALVFGACNNGEFEYKNSFPNSKAKLTITLSSGKTWEATQTRTLYAQTGSPADTFYTATGAMKSKGNYIKVDKEFQFYTDSDSTADLTDVTKNSVAATSDELADATAAIKSQNSGSLPKKGFVAFTGVKKGKTLIIDGYYALTKASVDGEYVEIEIIGQIED
ncbi:MAG: hypothetical protein Ta2F_18150 [Termitinemataceae bacterium]|nr:MAG: hypothetical protein Ta2F_18150 [Termitinemataceae bacterium]